MHNMYPSSLLSWSIRLNPGDDLRKFIDEMAKTYGIDAGIVVSCVGSLSTATIRFAGQSNATTLQGPFEIVALTGTISRNGSHLHVSLSDDTGHTTGGHLKEGNTVYTTVELCIGVLPDLIFTREKDETTGYPELTIQRKSAGKE